MNRHIQLGNIADEIRICMSSDRATTRTKATAQASLKMLACLRQIASFADREPAAAQTATAALDVLIEDFHARFCIPRLDTRFSLNLPSGWKYSVEKAVLKS